MVECFLDAEEVEGSIPSAPTSLKGVSIQRGSALIGLRLELPTLLNTSKNLWPT